MTYKDIHCFFGLTKQNIIFWKSQQFHLFSVIINYVLSINIEFVQEVLNRKRIINHKIIKILKYLDSKYNFSSKNEDFFQLIEFMGKLKEEEVIQIFNQKQISFNQNIA